MNLSQNKETRKQGEFNANSETITTLVASAYVSAVGIWNGKPSPKERMARLPSFRCSCPPKLKDQAHSIDSTGIFTSALHKLLSGIMTRNLPTEQGGKGKIPSHFWVEKQKFPFLWTSLSADDLSDVKALTEAHPGLEALKTCHSVLTFWCLIRYTNS